MGFERNIKVIFFSMVIEQDFCTIILAINYYGSGGLCYAGFSGSYSLCLRVRHGNVTYRFLLQYRM